MQSSPHCEYQEYEYQNYELLKVYAYYRLLLSSLLWAMYSSQLTPNILGTHNPALFSTTALSYTFLNIVTLVFLWRRQFTPRTEQIFCLLLIDIVAITLLLHASGGVDSGLGYLLIMCIAAGSIFITGQIAIALAAFASMAVIMESVFNAYYGETTGKTLFSAGSLGIFLFVTAHAFQYLTNRIRSSSMAIAEHTQQAAHLERLAQLIVERMRTGVIAINQVCEIELHNQSALRLLGFKNYESLDNKHLSCLPDLYDKLNQWRNNASYGCQRQSTLSTTGPEIRVSFAQLKDGESSAVLIFLEDSRLMAQEAQQLKLASLGRLTASIAHEIRNPLGAISHAAQLLNESTKIVPEDQRLSEIIQTHSKRVNHIIENILQLSSRKSPKASLLDIEQFLRTFTEEFNSKKDVLVNLLIKQKPLKTRFDGSQLHQILTNLCENGLRYSFQHIGKKTVTLIATISEVTELPYIDIIDEGPGISKENIKNIFEPFFTTESTGSGLGLYISKELCEANQASLHYLYNEAGKSCFRITLSHPQRIF